MTTYAKGQGQRSLGSKVRVTMDVQMDGRKRLHCLQC